MDIIKLPEQAIRLIRAGEVITSPAAVVNELLANALDAGATQIEVHISSNARDITVVDNGMGMTPEQAITSCQQHTTSKFTGIENIGVSETFGFRGEALHSILTMAGDMLLSSRTETCDTGFQFDLGAIRDSKSPMTVDDSIGNGHARPCALRGHGTVVDIRNLFETHAPRLKQMKRPGREIANVRDVCIAWGLMNDAKVTFSVRHPRKIDTLVLSGSFEQKVQTFASKSRAITSWIDYEIEDRILGKVKIRGALVDSPDKYFAINGRPVQYQGYVDAAAFASGRGDGFIISAEVDYKEVDVNIHPEKARVTSRGSLPSLIMDAVLSAQKGDVSHIQDAVRETRSQIVEKVKNTGPEYRILEMIDNKFALASNGSSIILCDIHAAHERMLQDASFGRRTETMLLEVELSPQERETLSSLEGALEREGWSFFEDVKNVVVLSSPVIESSTEIVLRRILSSQQSPTADIACHHAWREGQKRDDNLFSAIIEYAMTTPGGKLCNHGRPTIIELDSLAMQRLFHRR